jgi:hypothetical protein
MWECFINRIIPYYLIAHASHILQPLDLTVFSSLKRTYRAAVNRDSHLDDTAPVKKQRFLEYYQEAREQAMTTSNIMSGFASAGIVPLNSRKVLSSPFIIQTNKPAAPEANTTPITATEEPKVQLTPSNRRELYERRRSLEQCTKLDHDTRALLQGCERGFDRLHYENAQLRQRLGIVERQNNDYKAKRTKREAMDPNDKFIDIQDIKAKEDAAILATRATTTTRTARATSLPPQQPLNALEAAAHRVVSSLKGTQLV